MDQVLLSRSMSEQATVQNPALGAYALWKFGLAYQAREGKQAVLPLAFMVLPLMLHKPTLDLILCTNKSSGLALFAGKLGEKREEILAVHERARTLRKLTLESIDIGVNAMLLSIDYRQALLRANSLNGVGKGPTLSERIKWVTPAAEKIGHWFAGLADQQVARTLRVDF
jgi:hypothetical protein